MEPCDVIQPQLEVLRQNLIRCRSAVGNQKIDEKLRGRVAARFDKELTRLEAECKTLKGKVTSRQPLDVCWQELGKVQRDSAKVFEECLAFIQGALARTAGLDEEICGLTDDLLDDLAAYSDVPWGRFTLLATSELYVDKAEIIRIRYPEVSLWGMPLAAHEFGHYLGPQLRLSQGGKYIYPFQALLSTADETRSTALHTAQHTAEWYHLQECFADLFATYTVGPAYVAAFIVLRMNPGEAQVTTSTHPSGARRVHGILWTLSKMDELQATSLGRPFVNVIELLSEVWHSSLRQAGKPDKLADSEASLVNQRMAELFDLLADATPRQLGFGRDNWLRAEGVAARMTGDVASTTLPDQLSRRDVLNGAWLARLQAIDQSPYALNDIAVRALAEYRGRSRPAF